MKIKVHARNIDTKLRLALFAMTEFALARLIPSRRLRNNLSINIHLKHHVHGGEVMMSETTNWLWIGEKISATLYNFNAKEGWKFNLIGMAERPMMMEYEEGGGKYDWHIDLGPSRLASTRKLSFSLFLNDDYEGGEFQIKTGRENYIPPEQETGNLLFFPSYLVHRVTLVTKGTRMAIVGWVHGNSFQ